MQHRNKYTHLIVLSAPVVGYIRGPHPNLKFEEVQVKGRDTQSPYLCITAKFCLRHRLVYCKPRELL